MRGETDRPVMKEGSCRGIIFRLYPYSDASLILHVLSREQGLISLIAKGARRQKSSFAGRLDLFYLCQFEFILSRRSDLHTLRRRSWDEHRVWRKGGLNARRLECPLSSDTGAGALWSLQRLFICPSCGPRSEPPLPGAVYASGNAPKFDRMRFVKAEWS